MAHILIVEDDNVFSKILSNYLSKHQYSSTVAASVKAAVEKLSAAGVPVDLVLLDYHLPDATGIDLLDWMRSTGKSVPVIIMTSLIDIKTAVNAIKKGAYEYITKPIRQEELLMQIEQVLESVTIYDNKHSEPAVRAQGKPSSFVTGRSGPALLVQKHIDIVAPTDMSVLIVGESGTGKENVARAIHNKSKRTEAPFVAIDCGALSAELAASELFGHVKGAFTGALFDKKGHFELAKGGTVFLDEVGNLSYDVQIKLLRALQEKEIYRLGDNKPIKTDIRLICATNEDFKQAFQADKFREDLYHRINEFKIKIMPLRERPEDLEDFVSFFIEKSNQELHKNVKGISAEVDKLFRQYTWPGNIRELQNVVKRGVLLAGGDYITLGELPEDMELLVNDKLQSNSPAAADLKSLNEQLEKELIVKTLRDNNFNKSKTARVLNIDRTTLYNKLEKYGIIVE